MYGLTRLMDISQYLTVNDCFFFGALISATDPGMMIQFCRNTPYIHSTVYNEFPNTRVQL